ncbi:hypothetical protein MN608_10957 [Microdochium nivale]|nr:hypothetical protein MN608_10957 [Microdochium nivale]
MASDIVVLPVQVDAFTLNPAVCGSGKEDEARICPITQPNYTFLRLDNFMIQNDVQPHANLHNTAPAERNSRMMDLGEPDVSRQPRRNRQGIYLHWILPRLYRSGVTSTDSVTEARRDDERKKKGLDPIEPGHGNGNGGANSAATPAMSTPEFTQPPTRWLVVRRITLDSIQPATAKANFKELEAWVIESDYLWTLDEIPLDFDLQVDVSPFVKGVQGTGDKKDVEEQAEVFIGRKTRLEEWTDSQETAQGTNPRPVADISILRSSNQLFADFQLHNSNVFSMLDNFEYKVGDDKKYLDKADASYYILGWHAHKENDPLWNAGKNFARSDTLSSLFLSLKSPEGLGNWLEKQEQDRLLCHGAMYNVKWDSSKKPDLVPADDCAKRLRDPKLATLSFGTTPIDALITYCASRKDTEADSKRIMELEEDILAIEALLHATDDGVEGQREAKDTVYNWAFARGPGGKHFFLSGEDNPEAQPARPSDAAIDHLNKLNEIQLQLDACQRAHSQYAWSLFSWWWKYVSDPSNKKGRDVRFDQKYAPETAKISIQLGALQRYMAKLEKDITDVLGGKDIWAKKPPTGNAPSTDTSPNLLQSAKTATMPFFYKGRDPTALVGGIGSGWPTDFLKDVLVRLVGQVTGTVLLSGTAMSDFIPRVIKVLPSEFSTAVKALLSEFEDLRRGGDAATSIPGQVLPQFHDPAPDGKRLRDEWGNQQPWFPLYAEWSVEYTHVPFEHWKLDERTARLTDAPVIRYGISTTDGKPLYDTLGHPDTHDVRVLSGRSLVLPQPSFSLAAKIEQLFTNTPGLILKEYLDEDARTAMLADISQLSYLSCPLAGFTDQLTTLMQGSHIKPENKIADAGGERSVAIAAAIFAAAGFSKDVLEQIVGNSALTPFAAMGRFPDDKHCPFKPVTHGQAKLIKFNIFDKFGQTLTAVDAEPRQGGPEAFYPCISDWFEPQLVKDTPNTANTVVKDNDGQCEYLQLPPQINQNARLNAHFVTRTGNAEKNTAYWRPATEWENPIWGWIVTNFADSGIQFFLPDGTFYREVRFGGPIGAITQPKWMPFAPDAKNAAKTDTAQLDALIGEVGKPEYLKSFWHMITTAMANLPPAPTAYAQYLNSIVGKPLALVNTGWSLELDSQPLTNQSTNAQVGRPERFLLGDPKGGKEPHYTFQVKLGDKEREYDGMVGYFEVPPTPATTAVGAAPPSPPSRGSEFDLSTIKTYFAPGDDSKPHLSLISGAANYPTFEPYWIPPYWQPGDAPLTGPTDESLKPPLDPAAYTDRRNQKLQVYSTIVDPFTPIHAYSSFLPALSLQLPPWTWQSAMNTMTAFFHVGPLNLTEDVGEYIPADLLTQANARDEPRRSVRIPALPAGDWSWLQPYVMDPIAAAAADEEVPTFNAYGVDQRGDINKPGFQEAPYTAIEGFLQLRNPIGVDKPAPAPATPAPVPA